MNNYSWTQKQLHKFALSFKFIRETSFDIENAILTSPSEGDNHVFVCGLARSGTTILLNAIYHSNEYASLCYSDMPFILAPNIWSKLSLFKSKLKIIERAHGDGIDISTESPEAFEEVFWLTFCERKGETRELFSKYVDNIKIKSKKKRYLSKNNQNIKRIELISKIFPNAKILIPFRCPIQHSFSILNQHKRFQTMSNKDKFISNYMNWIGHIEFGPNYVPLHKADINFEDHLNINHWLEQWYLTYKLYFKKYHGYKNIRFISYEKLCNCNNYWGQILEFLEMQNYYSYKFKLISKKINVEYNKNLLKKSCSLYKRLNDYAQTI